MNWTGDQHGAQQAPVFVETVPGKGTDSSDAPSQADRPAEVTARPDRPARPWLSVLRRRLPPITPAFGPLARPLQRLL